MNLIFIYGPPAAGKLTTANALAEITGYRVFKNHTFVGCIADVFPFEEKKFEEVRSNLTRKLRLEILEEAAKQGVDIIHTFGMSGQKYFNFFSDVKTIVETNGGKVLFVQLLPSKETLLDRVEESSRKGNKIDSKEMLNDMLTQKPDVFDKFPDVDHLTLDNSSLSPEESAREIVSYYKL